MERKRIYLSDTEPLKVQDGGIITSVTNGAEFIVDGFDGEMPYQDVEHGVVGYYQENLIEDANGSGCLDIAQFAFWLLIIFTLAYLLK